MTRISARTTLTSRNDEGFSLIEILIVITLMAMVMALAMPSIGGALKINLQSSTRQLATTIRAAHDEAVLKGQVYRVAFDLDKNQYWVEVGDRGFLMRTIEQEEEEKKRNERRSDEEKEKHKEPFSLAQSVTKKKQSLPRGVQFSDILTTHNKEPLKAGIAYAHVFPHGFVEKITLHLKDNFDREQTLIVNSVTGKSRLYERYFKETDR